MKPTDSDAAAADVSASDSVVLTQLLTRIESTNPTLSKSGGSGERAIAGYLEAWFKHRGIECHRIEPVIGRPSVVGVVRGTGSGKSLMINGHIDTVSLAGYLAEPLAGAMEERNGREVITGRGAMDMKSGIASGMALLVYAQQHPLKGDIILAAVSDEEHLSKGTEQLLAAGWRADGAVVTEPTCLALGTTHKGFAWVEIDVLGVAAHGSMPLEGVDAIAKTAKVISALEEYAPTLPTDEMLGQASLHCGLITGGEEPSSYPSKCTLTVEFRTVPAQSSDQIVRDVTDLLTEISMTDAKFQFREPRLTFERKPHKIGGDHPLTQLTRAAAEQVLGQEVKPQGVFGWCDAALLAEAGVPSLVFGPTGEGLHGNDEWVDVESIRQTTDVLQKLAESFCN